MTNFSLTQWRLSKTYPQNFIPIKLRNWLLDAASTTKRMRQASGNTLVVKVLDQKWQKLTPSERLLLNTQCTRALVREVELFCNNQPWMFARSVFPMTTLVGKNKYIEHYLDERPIGDFLYSDTSLQRSEFEVAQIAPERCEYPALKKIIPSSQKPLWSRRSIFLLKNKPMLLTEVFLPAMVDFCLA